MSIAAIWPAGSARVGAPEGRVSGEDPSSKYSRVSAGHGRRPGDYKEESSVEAPTPHVTPGRQAEAEVDSENTTLKETARKILEGHEKITKYMKILKTAHGDDAAVVEAARAIRAAAEEIKTSCQLAATHAAVLSEMAQEIADTAGGV